MNEETMHAKGVLIGHSAVPITGSLPISNGGNGVTFRTLTCEDLPNPIFCKLSTFYEQHLLWPSLVIGLVALAFMIVKVFK